MATTKKSRSLSTFTVKAQEQQSQPLLTVNNNKIFKDLELCALNEEDLLKLNIWDHPQVQGKFTSDIGETFYVIAFFEDYYNRDSSNIEYNYYLNIYDSNGEKIFPLYNTECRTHDSFIEVNEERTYIRINGTEYPLNVNRLKQIQYEEADFIDEDKRFAVMRTWEENGFRTCGIYDSFIGRDITPEEKMFIPKEYIYDHLRDNTKKLSSYSIISYEAKESIKNYIANEQEELNQVLYSCLNTELPFNQINDGQYGKFLFEKYASLQPEERDRAPIDEKEKGILEKLILIRENPACRSSLRLC